MQLITWKFYWDENFVVGIGPGKKLRGLRRDWVKQLVYMKNYSIIIVYNMRSASDTTSLLSGSNEAIRCEEFRKLKIIGNVLCESDN